MPFLDGHDPRPVTLDGGESMKATALYLGGGGPRPVEIVVLDASRRPAAGRLREVWRAREGGRAAPVLLVALERDRAHLCGPSGNLEPPVFHDVPVAAAERICAVALDEPDTDAVFRFLWSALPRAEQPVLGLRNEGLLALHELRVGVPRRPDWAEACRRGAVAGGSRAEALVRALGFTVEPMPGPASLLRAGDRSAAVAIFLDRGEQPETAAPRFGNKSPVSYALSKADEQNLKYVIVTTGAAIRVYTVSSDVGVGRRGRSETYLELNLDLLPEDRRGYLWLLFSADALQARGSFEEIAAACTRYAADLGKRLRERIYDGVVWRLAEAIAEGRRLRKPTAEDLRETYRATLVLLFRLLFIAYAEDKDLLPYGTNARYRDRSLKKIANELRQLAAEGRAFDAGATYWDEVRRLFRAVDRGQKEWDVPVYDGGLFSPDADVSRSGEVLESVELGNDLFGPALRDLLLLETEDGSLGPVDFRSLGVREFGTIYEGLLDCELSVAEADLTTDKDGHYRPVKGKKDDVVVAAGTVYLHDRSGSRKASGSYYTKDFAVTHLLDHALEPALEEHLARIDAMRDDAQAAAEFFDFRVADIAMGSGHFLVAALDRIERRLANYLAKRPLPDVAAQLRRLRAAAHQALGARAGAEDIDDDQLLRRQIARRCIFGVDMNPLAVDLARLSLWIHTFVPGLPLSFLDHNLQQGNSLVGIATFAEAVKAAQQPPLFAEPLTRLLARGRETVDRLGAMADADAAEVKRARVTAKELTKQLAPLDAFFTILTAARVDDGVRARVLEGGLIEELVKGPPEAIAEHAVARKAAKAMRDLPPFHFPTAFPEVFRGDRPGFDVILGNPPWEEVTVEEDDFWTRYVPGFQGLPQGEQERIKARYRKDRPDLVAKLDAEVAEAKLARDVLAAGDYPGMGTGDPDLYKAFCWRFWALVRPDGGRIGVVLPRSALMAKGSTDFRKAILAAGRFRDLTFLLNTGGWVFDEAEPRYTIALVGIERRRPGADGTIPLRGPYSSYESFEECRADPPYEFRVSDVTAWTDTASLPLLPTPESGPVFLQLRSAPRFDHDDRKSWLFRPHTDLHATKLKEELKTHPEPRKGAIPIWKGESFDVWVNDTGSYYLWVSEDEVVANLVQKRANSARKKDSPWTGLRAADLARPETHPYFRPRVVFRDVSRATDTRTVRAALIPPHAPLTNTAPYLVRMRGDERDEAYVLGVLCAMPLDWFARRFVETHLNYHVFNMLPVPRPPRSDARWQRVVALAGRLAAQDDRLRAWATSVGVACGRMKDADRDDAVAELDAVVAHLYGLSEQQVVHIFETFHEGWVFRDRLARVLAHFRSWEGRR